MLSLVNPTRDLNMLGYMSLTFQVENSLAHGQLVMRTVASSSSLPVMTSRKMEHSVRSYRIAGTVTGILVLEKLVRGPKFLLKK